MKSAKNHRAENYIYYVLGIIEALLALRFLFKLLGANPGNALVSFLYGLTRILILPFVGIFRTVPADGTVFEPATILAMLIYGILAYGIARLFRL